MAKNEHELFDHAVRKLKEANDELCRPEEDVVAYMVCKNSQVAIDHFLRGYLIKHGVEPSKEANIDELHGQCKAINPHFERIDLAGFDCQAHSLESRYCSGTEKVSRCFDIADSLDSFLREEKIIR
ncbi:MAG: HEPN domain-containing protein [Flavobacteriaceae bacterium]